MTISEEFLRRPLELFAPSDVSTLLYSFAVLAWTHEAPVGTELGDDLGMRLGRWCPGRKIRVMRVIGLKVKWPENVCSRKGEEYELVLTSSGRGRGGGRGRGQLSNYGHGHSSPAEPDNAIMLNYCKEKARDSISLCLNIWYLQQTCSSHAGRGAEATDGGAREDGAVGLARCGERLLGYGPLGKAHGELKWISGW